VDTCVLSPVGPSFASPKSESFGLKFSSNNTFDALKSRYITGGSADSCKYSRPLAAPSAILILVFQSNGFLSGVKSERKIQLSSVN